MAEPGDPHSPQDGTPQGPNDDDLFRKVTPPATPQNATTQSETAQSATAQSQRPTWAAPVRPSQEPSRELDPHAHDDLIGFTSFASLAGTDRNPPTTPAPAIEPFPATEPATPEPVAPEPAAPQPLITPFPEPAPLIRSPKPAVPSKEALRIDDSFLKASPVPAWAVETPAAARPVTSPTGRRTSSGRADSPRPEAVAPEGATGLYTIYAMILFAVPTFGVAAVIGLFMVWTKPKPDQLLARSHFEFQTRTLWIAAIAAVIGVVLIAVNLGVFVLFLMAVWVIVRGAWGVMTLAAGKPVRNPRTWLL